MTGKTLSVRRVARKTEGSGAFTFDQLAKVGAGVVVESTVLVFHPEHIELGQDVYVGHYTVLKAYHEQKMVIGDGTWIGEHCFLHSPGGLVLGSYIGVGPGVKIITSSHSLDEIDQPILHSTIRFASVVIGDGSDIGVGAVILPGVRIGRGVQVGAGAVVASNVEDYAVVAGVPAKVIRMRR